VYVGKLEFIREYHEVNAETEKIVEQLVSEGKTSVVVSFGNGVAGIIGLTDEIKPDSISAIKTIAKIEHQINNANWRQRTNSSLCGTASRNRKRI
jgi:Cd2+/Zn2+-exporting ATPase